MKGVVSHYHLCELSSPMKPGTPIVEEVTILHRDITSAVCIVSLGSIKVV